MNPSQIIVHGGPAPISELIEMIAPAIKEKSI